MNRKTLAIVVGALVLFAGVLAATFAATSGSDSDAPVHTLPDGQIHTGELPEGETTMGEEMPAMEETTAP